MSKKQVLELVWQHSAAGTGAAAVAAKNHKKPETKTTKKKIKVIPEKKSIVIQNLENMKRTAREFIIPMVTTRHLPVRKSRKVSMRRMPTS